MMAHEPTHTHETEQRDMLSPRCGYDLHGVISSWTNACPLHGNCSECGLDIDWADIVQGRLGQMPRWYVENGGLRTFVTSIWTLLNSFALTWFWRRIKLEHEVRISPLMHYLVIAHVLALVASSAMCGIVATAGARALNPYTFLGPISPAFFAKAGGGWEEPVSHAFHYHVKMRGEFFDLLPVTTYFADPIVWLPSLVLYAIFVVAPLTMPLMYFLFSDSLGLSRIRLVHLLRATVIGSALMLLLSQLLLAFRLGISHSSMMVGDRYRWDKSELGAGLFEIGLIIVVPAVLLYWWSVGRFYLRFDRVVIPTLLLCAGAIILSFSVPALVFFIFSAPS